MSLSDDDLYNLDVGTLDEARRLARGVGSAGRSATYRRTNPQYRATETVRNRERNRDYYNEQRRDRAATKPFVMWDAEGTNTTATPFLFGSSDGDRIAHPDINSAEMLDLILAREQIEPDVIHFGYGFEYDINMMLRDLPLKLLMCLKNTSHVKWEGYELHHIPRKWFQIKRDKTIAKIFDVVSFFGCGYIKALEEHKVGTDEQRRVIREGKEDRRTFTYADISYIEPYWRTELSLGPNLMDKLRNSFYNAGMFIRSWHGPGSLARYGLTHRGIKEVMAESPKEIHDAARYGFCGGRFESFLAGHTGQPVWNADINSAYPYAATHLPNLATGRWTYSNSFARENIDPHKLAIYHITFEVPNSERTEFTVGPQPLFRRYQDDRVMWPNSVDGWYWSPEAWTVRGDKHAVFHEAYIFHDDGSKPFEFLGEHYRQRLIMKANNDPTELTLKLFINSVFGQTAQRAGWQRGIPKFHQLEYAGFITSTCRAMIYEAARKAWDRGELISCDTDGIFTTGPIPEDDLIGGTGDALGQWKVDSVPGILYWQSGVYWTPSDSCTVRDAACEYETESDDARCAYCHNFRWKLKKARGAPKGAIPFDRALEALEHLVPIEYKRQELIGYRWGLRNGMQHWRYFIERDRRIQFGGSQFSKRIHNPRMCRLCRGFIGGTLHDLSPIGNGFTLDNHSKMHVLPWEQNDHERPRDWIDEKSDTVIDLIWTEEP